jgi:hypothetical protein
MLVAGKNGFQRRRIDIWRAALDRVERRLLEAEIARAHLILRDLAVPEVDHRGGAQGRDLVEPRVGRDDEGARHAHGLQRLAHDAGFRWMEHADQLGPHAGRIGEGSQQVEQGAHGQRAAQRDDGARRRMVERRKQKADADLGDQARRLFRRPVDGNAERLQHVGAAALRGGRPVAVLGDRDAGAGGDQRRRGREVEAAGAVAARTGRVEHGLEGERQRHGARLQRGRRADQLLDRLALDAQPDQEAGDLRFGTLLVDQEPDRLRHLLAGQILAVGDFFQQLDQHQEPRGSREK